MKQGQGALKSRNQGMVRPWHIIVLLIFLILVFMLAVGLYVNGFRSEAQGEARDLYYDTADYVTACAVEGIAFKPDREDGDYYYITKAKTLAPYHKGEIKGEIEVKIDKRMETQYATTTYTKTFFGTYLMRSTEVFPKDAIPAKGLEWIKIEPEKNSTKER